MERGGKHIEHDLIHPTVALVSAEGRRRLKGAARIVSELWLWPRSRRRIGR